MMHAGVLQPSGLPVQIAISGARAQLSTQTEALWAGRARDLRLHDSNIVEIRSRGGSWSVRLDDVVRFSWEFRHAKPQEGDGRSVA